MATQATPKSRKIKFQLLGTPNLSMQTGTNKNGETVWFDPKKAKKFEIPESQVVRHKSGKAVNGGRIRWANGTRVILFSSDETDIIEALEYHSFCENGPNGKIGTAKYRMVDDEKEKHEKYVQLQKEKNAMQMFLKTSDTDLRDIAACLGYDDTDKELYEGNIAAYVKSNPAMFMEFFHNGLLKDEYRIGAIARRAAKYKVLEVNKGAYYFKGELIGTDMNAVILNLQNSSEGSSSAKADALPLIIEALEKRIDPYGKKRKV